MADGVSEPKRLERIAAWLAAARRGVAFTGAGISTESGIPDFRSPGGIWSQARPVMYGEFLASADARYEYWRQKAIAHRDFASSEPNAGHRVLSRWQQAGRLVGLVTQNIDELHQQAGSRHVVELHGTARSVGCLECGRREDADAMVEAFLERNAVPSCPDCGGILKHATISFGQSLDEQVLRDAIDLARRADLFLAIGSSLVVEPAASLPRMAQEGGAKLVIVNREPTPLDPFADAIVHSAIGETLTAIDELLSAA